MAGVASPSCVPRWSSGWYALRRERRARATIERTTTRSGRSARNPAQLPGAAGLLRPLQRGRDRGAQRPRRPRSRAVRRRADPRQGRAVPAAVRRGRGVPRDVHGRRAAQGARRGACCGRGARRAVHHRRICAARTSRWSSSAGTSTPRSQSRLWLFAVLGTVLAMLQLLVYSVLARQGQRSVYLVWGAVVAVVGVGLLTLTSLDGL